MSIWDYITTDNGRLYIAGFFGSVVAAALDYTGVIPAIRRIIVGTIIAVYTYELALPLTRLFLGLFDVPKEPSVALSGFLSGVIGVVFVETLLLAGKRFSKRFTE